MVLKRSNLREMDFLQDLKSIQNEYYSKYGHEPVNVSDWNPSIDFKEKVQHKLIMDNKFNPIDYVFSYTFSPQNHDEILSKLGYNNYQQKRSILITPNGSSSIRNALHWLKQNKCNKLLAISPTYFTVFCGCQDYGIEYKELFLHRYNSSFVVDEKELFDKVMQVDAVWITSPVYCTSTYFDNFMINNFIKILKLGKIIIADESLCISGHELIRKLGNYTNFLGIYSPHKSLCVNGNKFSLITYAKEEDNVFNDWVVALSGNLLISNGIAVNHFLSDAFEKYSNAFNVQLKLNFMEVKKLLYELEVDFDYEAQGYLITLYFKNIDGNLGYNEVFLKKLINNTGTTMIPGVRNHFSADLGFCFRINLCCLNINMYHALKRLIIYLKSI